MSRKKNFNREHGAMKACSVVDQVVRIERARGAKTTAALSVAAEVLGVAPRRVLGYYYDEPIKLHDAPDMLARFHQYLAGVVERNEKEIDDLRALLRSLEAIDAVVRSMGKTADTVAQDAHSAETDADALTADRTESGM